jgi:hypothetical protein
VARWRESDADQFANQYHRLARHGAAHGGEVERELEAAEGVIVDRETAPVKSAISGPNRESKC